MPLKTIIHHITHAPAYYYDHFFCPVKRETFFLMFSGIAITLSYYLSEFAKILDILAPVWGVIAKLLSGLILVINFFMVVMALKKRIRDWDIDERSEGKKEFDKRNKK